MASQEVIHAYRNLYRGLLQAVKYSSPARYTARDRLRRAFREPAAQATALDADALKRTIWFLQAAAKETGMEHKVLRNLLKVGWHRDRAIPLTKSWRLVQPELKRKKPPKPMEEARDMAYQHYDMTIAMLNKTMGLCLR